MLSDRPQVEVLLVQFWINDPGPITAAIGATGVEANVKRGDIEPALNAALSSRSYDVIIYDPATPGVTLQMVQRCMASHASTALLVMVDDVMSLDDVIATVVRRRCS